MTLTKYSPIVLLIDELGKDCFIMKSWLETEGYYVREANNVYDALEEMTDMTLEQSPSMVLLNSYSLAQDRLWVMHSLHEFAESRDVPIVSLSASNSGDALPEDAENFVKVDNFELLKPLMQTLLPIYSQARAAA